MVTILRHCLLTIAMIASPVLAQSSPEPIETAVISTEIAADEARQGAASDGAHVYAIDNSRIGKYRIGDGAKVAAWEGDTKLFPHLNSCTIAKAQLVCAASNYPAVPHSSSIEFFDPDTLQHIRSHSIGTGPGSLTVLDYHDGSWWAVFANYDGKGGDPARDHRYTVLVQMDEAFRRKQAWTFPPELLAKFAPKSCSGASWHKDGKLYLSGHDLPEIYAVTLPEAGSVLKLEKTISVSTRGQAIDWDPLAPDRLWSISRQNRKLIASIIE